MRRPTTAALLAALTFLITACGAVVPKDSRPDDYLLQALMPSPMVPSPPAIVPGPYPGVWIAEAGPRQAYGENRLPPWSLWIEMRGSNYAATVSCGGRPPLAFSGAIDADGVLTTAIAAVPGAEEGPYPRLSGRMPLILLDQVGSPGARCGEALFVVRRIS